MNFGNLKLNDKIKSDLSAAVDNGKLSHAVLLTGGTKKERRDLSVLLAQALLCEKENKPCLKCDTCKKIKNNVHPDVNLTISDEKSIQTFLSAEDIRELKNRASLKPNEAEFQIFIFIFEGTKVNIWQQNAILNIIEEPPPTARFIFAAKSKDVFKGTVLSRLTVYQISPESGVLAGDKLNPKVISASKDAVNALIEKNEYLFLASVSGIFQKSRSSSDRLNFKDLALNIAWTLRNALVGDYLGYNDETSKAIAEKYDKDALIKMIEILTKAENDADESANLNILSCALTIDIFGAAEKYGA